MEQFYLKNLPRYHKLVGALDPYPKPRITDGKPGPNMIVSARIRPLAQNESFPSAVFPRANQGNVMDIHDLYNHPKGVPVLKSFDYQVDQLFPSTSTTSQIYTSLIANLVPYAWNGGVGTLFAYGQTGSGKTFTISKIEELIAETLMASDALHGEREIYMTVIDLAGNSAFDLLSEREPISLLEDASGATQMVGARETQVFTADDMKAVVERATSFRRTAPTLKNPASSRSHAICRIRIRDVEEESDGVLYLVDLAGSEAARDISVHGADRMREAKQINVSLSVLKDCIRAKAEADTAAASGDGEKKKVPHIPFRQSALTRVLKHVFDPAGARACRTIVIACINPSLADVGPTKNTLRFAELLRVSVPATDGDGKRKVAIQWTNAELKEWIKENAGKPPVLGSVVAPRESGAQFFLLSTSEIDYRCQKCPGVKRKQAQEFRRKLWERFIDL